MTQHFGGLVPLPPAARSGQIARFAPAWWTLDFNLPAAAGVVTEGADGLVVRALYRNDRDFVGLIWETEDRFGHPLHRYEAQPSYRGCRLRFRWIGDAQSKPLDVEDAPVLTIETYGGAVHYVRLWNHRVLPNPHAADDDPFDQTIEIDFDGLRSGFAPPDPEDREAVAAARVPVDEIRRLMLSIVPAAYVDDATAPSQPLPAPVDFSVVLRDIACLGENGLLARETAAQPVHALRMTDGYDNAYHLTPERVVASALQLGYREQWVLYLGISHFHALAWDAAADAFRIDPSQPALNGPAGFWLADFCARLATQGFTLWLSVSFEVLADFLPPAWAQRDHAGQPGLTGWTPPSALIAPTSAPALAWLASVAVAALDIATAAGLAPRWQIGEPWWWDGSFDAQPRPHLYDLGTLEKYHQETGLFAPTPYLQAVTGPPGPHLYFLQWCRDQLGAATETLKAAVTAAHPAAETALLLFTPQVFRPDSEILTLLNFPGAAWAWPAFDRLQIEDYDWVVEARFDLSERTWEVAYDTLGYPPERVHYFAGFVLYRERAWQWRWIDAAIGRAFARDPAPAEVFVWSREQVLRDGYSVGAPPPWPPDPAPRLTSLATCWRIHRRDGVTLGFTTHDRPLTRDGLTFRPAAAFEPTEIVSTTRLAAASLEALGGFEAEEITEAELRAGLYDGAKVAVLQLDWRDPEAPPLLLAKGRIGEIAAEEAGFRVELRGAAARLGQPLGELYQPHCRADLGDARCKVPLEPLTLATTVTGSGGGGPFEEPDPQILAVAASVADGAFDFGLLSFTGGANAGLAFEIRESRGGRLFLVERPPLPVAAGDAVALTPGCDKTAATCAERYDNLLNFRGEPFLPGADAVLRGAPELREG